MTLADWVTLVLAVWAAVKVWLGRPQRIVSRNRRTFLSPFVSDAAALDRRIDVICSGARPSAADELSWLADRLGVAEGLGLQFALDHDGLASISAAYAGYLSRLDRGVLLGQTNVPLVQGEATLCRDVLALLGSWSGRATVASESRSLVIPHRGMTLTLHGCGTGSGSAEFGARDLLVSYRRHRSSVFPDAGSDPTGTLRDTPLDGVSHEERRGLAHELVSHRWFDGVLPRLTGWRVERDLRSGREVLHLSLAETTYAAVLLDHYPQRLAGSVARPVTGSRVGLLTLSATPLTACGHIVFALRSRLAGSHQERFGPAISGNLELRSRLGLNPDTSAGAVPDPLGALAREAREELGLSLVASDFTATGLATFSVPSEVNSHILLAVAPIDCTLEELPRVMRRADLVEGAWEVGRTLLGLRLPQDEAELNAAVDWLVGSQELIAHATLAGLGALAALTSTTDVMVRAERSMGRAHPVGRPDELVRAVVALERPTER